MVCSLYLKSNWIHYVVRMISEFSGPLDFKKYAHPLSTYKQKLLGWLAKTVYQYEGGSGGYFLRLKICSLFSWT